MEARKIANRRDVRGWVWLSIIFTALSTCCFVMPETFAQPLQDATKEGQTSLIAELHRMPGRVIMERTLARRSSALPLTKYTLEELEPSEMQRTEMAALGTDISEIRRITLYGGPFQVLAMPATLKVGNNITVAGVESADLKKITFVILNGSLLKEDDTLTFSYGGPGGINLGRLSKIR